MAGDWVVCHDKEATHRCIQCHKPVCDDCSFKDDQGVFCGRDCAGAHRSYGEADARHKKSGGKRVVLLILVIAAVLVCLVVLGKQGKGPFKSLQKEAAVEEPAPMNEPAPADEPME